MQKKDGKVGEDEKRGSDSDQGVKSGGGKGVVA